MPANLQARAFSTPSDAAFRRVEPTTGKAAKKNTIDLQWKMGANYNARPCDGERKSAGAITMANNGKNNAQNNGNSRKSARVLTSGCDRVKTGKRSAGANASARPPLWAPGRFRPSRMSATREQRPAIAPIRD
jgi:hypothetical protein